MWEGTTHYGWYQSWQVTLGYITKQDEQTSKQHPFKASASAPVLTSLDDGLQVVNGNNLLHSQVVFGHGLYQSNRKQARYYQRGSH